ncbi:citrate synthase [Actinomadura sp. NBRC 104425]|uniref:citrate/2-methylcitrate synthase n=1 Tax=Actinomadura sp. NBRC 104425 TaxID=3032204 RepID=UPI0024A37D13|nr:citrate/2-methylcitrate synthase [Actinomadura sp. NBRC 104425]GLZ12438.1 citrate synthase [Actinomadura sp. NBRC 104425]
MAEHAQAGEWIDAAAAARRLGVKPATLYSYVSRGVLRRRRDCGGRRSLFDAAEVEQLARRGRPRRPPAPAELVIESSVTALGADRPYYRGRDALELAGEQPFEAVAAWLWTGEPGDGEAGRWRASGEGLAAAVAAQSGLPADVLPLDRLQVITTALAAADPLRFHLDRPGVIATARALIAGLVDALPRVGSAGRDAPPAAGAEGAGTIAERLWGRLCGAPPSPGLMRALQAALVLMADHELAASTLAARVAASVRADPYAVVAAGLGVLGGPLHGGASYGAELMLAEIGEPGRASRVIGERLRGGQRIPGLGHSVYKSGDARFARLYGLVRDAAPDDPRLDVVDAVLAEASRRRLPAPNSDLALAALTSVAGMAPGAGEVVFAVARTAGWIAHALEEYGRGGPLRPRAVYTGPPPT